MKKLRKGWLFGIAVSAVLAAGVWFRGAGLWHGLDQEIVFHPDEPKQVKRLESYLRGVYVHHVGSRFYDGYPYGLNRVDEGLLRAWQGLAAMAGSWAEGKGSVSAGLPDHVAVYRQARVLRLLYGMAAALLVFAAARRWGAGRWAALAGAALYAASPLASLVSHAATGDIGVDLSVAAALYAAAALAVGGRAAWWVAFGAACGAGWACKFQGALAAWMAVPPLLLGLRDGWRGWKRLAGAGLLAAAGFAGAAVLLNPALALDTSRAWKDTWQNFGFIQNYGVPPERLAWPFGRKVAWGLSHNVPFVAGCLGWGLVAVGLAASAVLAGEACGAAREAFFWRRPDIRDAARLQAEAAFGDAGWGMGRHAGKARGIKRYYVEPATLPCFRNAASVLACPGEAWREGQALLPVPPVPMPSSAGDCWIFMDGPVFPRSDRMFAVPATGNGHRQPAAAADGSPLYADTLSARGAWTERILAFPAAPRNLRIGLRTGRMPVRCEVTTSLSGAATPRLLPPESQTVLELPRPDPVYAFAADGEAGRPAVWACRLRVRAQLGPVWVTVLGSPEEEELFALHGPGAAPAVHPVAADLPLFAGELERIRYLDSAGPLVLPADGDAPLPPPVPGAGPGLPAGPYLFRARVDSPAPAEVSFLLADRNESDAPDALPSARFAVPAGESDIEWRFQKPYAPYGATLRASAGIPGVTLLSWNLKPDPVALAAEGGYVPPPPAAPLLPGGADPDAVPATPLGLSYPGIGTLLDIRIPDAWHVSDTVPYAVTVRLDPSIPHKRFAELAFFLHLEDANGGLAWTLDYNLPAATFEGGPVRWKLNTPNLAPGTYTLTAGLFVARHGKKVPFAPHRRSMEVKRVTVLPDE